MKRADTLVLIPTYNEKDNVAPLAAELLALRLELDILFLDDASPDGTGRILDGIARENPRVRVVHRPAKAGIGSAHKDGIRRAYREGYARLITMDCDFTHPPSYIPEFVEASRSCDVVVGSRHLRPDSLTDWQWGRLVLTRLGYVMTRNVLRLPYDATGAYRLYRLDRVPPEAFEKVKADGYSFFFESLFLLHFSGFAIREVGIHLPARAAGSSKMTVRDAWRSFRSLFALRCASWRRPGDFRVERGSAKEAS